MRYGTLAFFFGIWAISAVVTGAVTQNPTLAATGGSAESLQSLSDGIFDAEEAQIAVDTEGNVVSNAFSFGKAATGWIGWIFNSALLNSEIWEGWAAPFRWAILILQLPFLILLLLESAKVLSGFIPFT